MQMMPNPRRAWMGALSLIAIALFTVSARADATLYKEYCAKCHARAAALAANLKGQTEEAKTSSLDAFLQNHHAGDVQVRAKIVAYLVELSSK